MTHGFRRTRAGVAADLAAPEVGVLVDLIRQTEMLLADDGPSSPPDAAGEGTPADAVEAGDADDAVEAVEPGDEFEAIMRGAGFTGTAQEPPRPSTDPAVRRLLPDAHRDDPEAAEEFRRLAGESVRERKLDHLRRAADVVERSGGRLQLEQQEAVSLLIALTDVRLVLGSRLSLDDDASAESLSERVGDMEPTDPMFALALGYEFLTWLQETLAVALTP
ncbi:MAG: DUF2017 family protein [Mobilicoccus sp.]|nr:DUF2017 family protein [Mobilicoccus sp.]